MTKNTTSQKKKKKSKRDGDSDKLNVKNIPRANYKDSQFYAIVERTLGNCRFSVKIILNDNIKIPENINTSDPLIAHLPRSQKRGGYINDKMIVLISHRVFENKADICYQYKDDETRYLIDIKEIPPYAKQFTYNQNECNTSDNDDFDFDYGCDENNVDNNVEKNDSTFSSYELKMPTSSDESSDEGYEESNNKSITCKPTNNVSCDEDNIDVSLNELTIKNNILKEI